jgi:hypothetical protein
MSFYVYQYSDPNTGIPFYIGKGTGRRSEFHLWAAKAGKHKNKLLANVIKKIGTPVIEILSTFENENDAYDEEERLIAKYGRRLFENGVLCNMTLGNRGPLAFKHTPESKMKMSESHTDMKYDRSLEHNSKISASNKGKPKSSAHTAGAKATRFSNRYGIPIQAARDFFFTVGGNFSQAKIALGVTS